MATVITNESQTLGSEGVKMFNYIIQINDKFSEDFGIGQTMKWVIINEDKMKQVIEYAENPNNFVTETMISYAADFKDLIKFVEEVLSTL